jgi:hypothetical protein
MVVVKHVRCTFQLELLRAVHSQVLDQTLETEREMRQNLCLVGDEMFKNNSDCSSQASSSGFPENRYEALEESRRLLGLTEPDFHSVLKVLCRTKYGTLDFSLGKVSISLSTYGDEEVFLSVGLGQGPVEKSAEYKFHPSELGLSRKQKRLEDFGEE